jgi:hypothetical protein
MDHDTRLLGMKWTRSDGDNAVETLEGRLVCPVEEGCGWVTLESDDDSGIDGMFCTMITTAMH